MNIIPEKLFYSLEELHLNTEIRLKKNSCKICMRLWAMALHFQSVSNQEFRSSNSLDTECESGTPAVV